MVQAAHNRGGPGGRDPLSDAGAACGGAALDPMEWTADAFTGAR